MKYQLVLPRTYPIKSDKLCHCLPLPKLELYDCRDRYPIANYIFFVRDTPCDIMTKPSSGDDLWKREVRFRGHAVNLDQKHEIYRREHSWQNRECSKIGSGDCLWLTKCRELSAGSFPEKSRHKMPKTSSDTGDRLKCHLNMNSGTPAIGLIVALVSRRDLSEEHRKIWNWHFRVQLS